MTNDAKVVVDFLKSNIFCQFGVPKAFISDQGDFFAIKPGLPYSISMGWFIELPQHTTPPIPVRRIGSNSLRMLYGHTKLSTRLRSGCLPIELSLVVKQCNLAYDQVGKQRKLQLQELHELRLEVYENSWTYKQKVSSIVDGMDHLLSLMFFPMVQWN
ncbi:hypothetical protein CR513_34826, partial [Mucuna pruriens]